MSSAASLCDAAATLPANFFYFSMNPFLAQTAMMPDSAGSLLDHIPDLGADVAAEPFLHESFWTLGNIAIGVLVILMLAGLTFWLYRRFRPKKTVIPPSAEQIALARLAELEAQQLPARALSLQLSLLLREYITKETQEPTLYETHQELSSRLDSLSSIPVKFQYELRALLEELAEMKYAAQAVMDSNWGNVGASPYSRARELITGIAEAERKQQAQAELNKKAERKTEA